MERTNSEFTNSEPLAKKICDNVHLALWATLTAFVLWFVMFVAPDLPAIHARAAALQARETAAEQDSTCGKMGMGPQSPMYDRCIAGLEDYRARLEQRFADASDFF